MKRKLLIAAILLSVIPATLAQRRANPAGGAPSGRQGQRSRAGTLDQDRIQDRDRLHDQLRDRDLLRDRDQMRDRLRIHATDQQRDHYRNCTQSANQARSQARQMTQFMQDGAFNAAQAQQHHNQLRVQVQAMQQGHTRLMAGLSAEQRAAVQNCSRSMDKIQERMTTRLQAMASELNNANPDQERLAQHAREMERAMDQWQKQNQALASDLSLGE